MTPEELIEAVPVGARHRSEHWCSSWLAHFVHEPWASRLEPLYSQATVQSLISERDAALARVAELEARCDPQNTTPMIIRDLCELDPADSENLNVICVHVDDLRLVMNERMKPCEHDFDEAPGQGYFCRNCGVPKS